MPTTKCVYCGADAVAGSLDGPVCGTHRNPVDGKGREEPNMPATITRKNGPAGQISYTAVTEDGPLTFVGSEYGGPIVMVTPSGAQTFVTDPGRFADSRAFGNLLTEDWVRNFLSAA